jgi:ferredoxin-nitrite reductase
MLHRAKRTPGQFMMRLRVPNGIVNADQMRFYADSVAKYGNEHGVIDITTRASIVSIAYCNFLLFSVRFDTPSH